MAEKLDEEHKHNNTVKGALVKFVKHSHLFEKEDKKEPHNLHEKKEEKHDGKKEVSEDDADKVNIEQLMIKQKV